MWLFQAEILRRSRPCGRDPVGAQNVQMVWTLVNRALRLLSRFEHTIQFIYVDRLHEVFRIAGVCPVGGELRPVCRGVRSGHAGLVRESYISEGILNYGSV